MVAAREMSEQHFSEQVYGETLKCVTNKIILVAVDRAKNTGGSAWG